jgi:hypothetical protein
VTTYATSRAVSKTAGYDRLLVDGVDVTYFRGVPTPIPEYLLTEPYAYGPTTLAFPQIDGNLETLGAGDLSWIQDGARVEIQRVDADSNVLATDYVGRVIATVVDGRNLTLEVGGELSGPASLINKQPPLVRRVNDVGFWFANLIQTLRLNTADRDGPITGIEIPDGGGGLTWEAWGRQLCSLSQTDAGSQRTIMPTTWGGKTWAFEAKDTTTVDLTLFTDDARVVARLRDDVAEKPNTFYGTCVTPDGVRVRNSKYPGVIDGPAPEFPGVMTVGDTDADTTTGDGVTVLNDKLVAMHYLSITASFVYGDYTTATAAAVRELQDRAGLSVTGTVNSATWDALFDVSATGFSLSEARIDPIVQASSVRLFDYTANGSIAGLNDSYDRTVLPVDRNIDYGPGITKPQMLGHARGQYTKIASGKNWVGTIDLNGFGGFAGEWDTADAAFLNDPDTGPAHIMSQLDIRPGMNAWLPMFDGGTLVHISGVSVNRATQRVTLTVDTMARDLLEVAAIIERNAEARRSPRREWFAENRASKPAGNLVERDEHFGQLGQRVELEGNEWNIIPVIVGQHGQVNRVDLRTTNDEAEFAVAFFSQKVTRKRLNRRIGNPLTTADESVWETGDVQDWFEDRVLLYASGDGKQPCGYFPRRHRNDAGDVTDAPITGQHLDDATWPYICAAGSAVLIYMAIYPDRDCTLRRGQILWPQLDDIA